MQIFTYLSQVTGRSLDELLHGPAPLVDVFMHPDTADAGGKPVLGAVEIRHWDASLGVPEPSPADIAAARLLPEPEVVPQSVSSAQAKIQLARTPGAEAGKTLLDDVTGAVQAAGVEAQIWFAEARTWERANPYVLSLAKALRIPDAQVDALFIAAAKVAA